jgi:hypothetical protein
VAAQQQHVTVGCKSCKQQTQIDWQGRSSCGGGGSSSRDAKVAG